MSICKTINAIKLPLRICPLKDSVCSKDAVTKEIYILPSAFMANKIMAMSKVSAAMPM
jgi:hypothetical protein